VQPADVAQHAQRKLGVRRSIFEGACALDADAPCLHAQKYFKPILERYHAFLVAKQSFLFCGLQRIMTRYASACD
jgi:hypothetical protein